MSEEFHNCGLNKLCRVCGETIKGWKKEVSLYLLELKEVFSGVNFDNDVEYIHPKFLCRKCYSMVLNVKKKGIITSQVIVNWYPHEIIEECKTCAMIIKNTTAGRKKKKVLVGRPPTVKLPKDDASNKIDVTSILSLSPSKPLPADAELIYAHITAIKIKQSTLPHHAVQVKSGGPSPRTLIPVTVARKDSCSSSARTVKNRTVESKEVLKLIAGDNVNAITKQTASIVKSMDVEARKKIIDSIGESTISIPANNVAAIKGTLNISWNKLRDISRWLATFNIKFASEKKSRLVAKEMAGKGLVAEMAPLIISKGKGKPLRVEPTPWCYIYNLVGHVLNRLTELKAAGEIEMHASMQNEIHVKIGGDHGGESFKECYQICNVRHPNKKENTIVFSIFEAKDSRTNLRVCLERFQSHIDQLSQVTWEGLKFRVFMFGDYQYLSFMYGISGASGRHCCLWCSATYEEMQADPVTVKGTLFPRSLETLKDDYLNFTTSGGKKLKNAKLYNNVIEKTFFNVPLSQVCLGLHLTLGIVLKMFLLLEKFAILCDMDLMIATSENLDLELLAEISNCKSDILEMEEEYSTLQDERNYILISGTENEDIGGQYDIILSDIERNIDLKTEEVNALKRRCNADFDEDTGVCKCSLDNLLMEIGVDRKPYYGECIIGNHCHKILKLDNIEKLCNAIPTTIREQTDDNSLYDKAVTHCKKISTLLEIYSSCEDIYNSASALSDDLIVTVEENIEKFMKCFRLNFPKERITPKMHIFEYHIIEFLQKWKMGCGFYGEQGGEAVHQEFNKMIRPYGYIRNRLDRLKYMMDMHMLSTAPKAVSLKVEKKHRNLKRNVSE